MRYGIDGRYIQDHFPGIGRYTYNLIRHLAPLAPEDEIIVFHDPLAPNSQFSMDELHDFPNVVLVPAKVSPFSLSQQLVFPSLVRRQQLSLYHSPYYVFPYMLSCPTIVSLHDLIPLLCPDALARRHHRQLFAFLARLAVRRAAEIVVDSESTRLAVMERWHVPGERVFAIPLAADDAFGSVNEQAIGKVRKDLALEKPYLLHVGTNKPHKNLPRLVAAWAALPPTVRCERMLVLAGPHDPRYPQVLQQVAQHGLGREVRLLGQVSGRQLPALYAGAEAFVFPSLQEGFGLPVLEAMASGVPVACSNRPSLPEVAGQAALLFDPEQVSEMATALEQLLTEPELRARLAGAGRQQAKSFSWSRTAADTLRVYRRLAGVE